MCFCAVMVHQKDIQIKKVYSKYGKMLKQTQNIPIEKCVAKNANTK